MRHLQIRKTISAVIAASMLIAGAAHADDIEIEPIAISMNTQAGMAYYQYQDEYQAAQYKYASDNIYVACTQYELTTGGKYILTHVVTNSGSQIEGILSYDNWGGERETAVEAAARTGAVLMINASYFDYGTGEPVGGRIAIANGYVQNDEVWSNGYEICLYNDGTLLTPNEGVPAGVLLSTGCKFTFGTGEDTLIQDYTCLQIKDTKWASATYPRCCIGMVRPCEYYIITAGEYPYAHGITLYDEQAILSSVGCSYARGLDGGGSATLVLNGELINSPADTGEARKVIDFIGFYDAAR